MQEILEEFSYFKSWEEKYSYIIEMGKDVYLEKEYKIPQNLVSGCVSKVWLMHKEEGDKRKFYADSDAIIVKGLLAIVMRVFSGKNSDEIMQINFSEFFEALGLKDHLSPSRSNGLFAVVSKIKGMVQ